ncbi:uncharacterized protein LOC109501804 isoform X2 [Felis catus]|uniref:uncharacterized protein LOC109501804 isoform X2 n=1 Tax=Felis catus TaxID=9685 RepID=UPI001D198DD9|nr:uncharacterized protein LOC109501804 isoform X2 [Felis catus]
MLEGRQADPSRQKTVGAMEPGPAGRVPVSPPCQCPARKWGHHRGDEVPGPTVGPPVARGVGTCCWASRGLACPCACVGGRARVFRPRVRGPCVRVCAVRARVPRVCTGVAAAAGARPGRGSACPSLCAPARPPERSIASGQECACVGPRGWGVVCRAAARTPDPQPQGRHLHPGTGIGGEGLRLCSSCPRRLPFGPHTSLWDASLLLAPRTRRQAPRCLFRSHLLGPKRGWRRGGRTSQTGLFTDSHKHPPSARYHLGSSSREPP